ncbi:type IX secretion system outer membrane channel protein PorV [soil metagenome]
MSDINFSTVLLNKITFLFLALIFLGSEFAGAQSILPTLGDSRSGTSGFQFLKVNVDARSAAMGSSNVAAAVDGSSLYLNPALASRMDKSQFYLSHTSYFADISLNYAGFVQKFNTVAIGGSLMFLDSGVMDETTEFNPFGTGRTFRTIHMAGALTFSQRLTNYFSYGASIKYLDERIEEIQTQTMVVDVGFFYQVGETGLRFAIGLNNFGFDSSPSGETTRQTLDGPVTETNFEEVSPPTMFMIGAAFDAYESENFNLLLTGQVTNPSDNAERFSIGSELGFIDRFFVRAGYEFGVEEALYPNGGVGFKVPFLNQDLAVDYGFSTRERLGNLHRFALKFNI